MNDDKLKAPGNLRRAFIRVSARNEVKSESVHHDYKVGEIVSISFEDIISNLEDWEDKKALSYFAIEHDHGEENQHYHIVLKFANSTKFKDIKSRFPFGKIEKAKSLKKCIEYLVHKNNPEKKPYSWDEVKTNNQTDFEAIRNSISLDELLEKIDQGEIKEYNYFDYIPPFLYARHKRDFENHFKYFNDLQSSKQERDQALEVLFIELKARAGKTSLAKDICEYKGYSWFLAPSNNDPLQNYKGQDALILDDSRPNTFKSINEYLAFLDEWNISHIRRRYNNPSFYGKLIIMTTNLPIDEWFKKADNESKKAFYCRFRAVLSFQGDYFTIKRFNASTGQWEALSDKQYKPRFTWQLDEGEVSKNREWFQANAGDTAKCFEIWEEKALSYQ